jgi:hypothetical protein
MANGDRQELCRLNLAATHEKRKSQRRLDFRKPLRHRGLRGVQRIGCCSKASAPRNGEQDLEMSKAQSTKARSEVFVHNESPWN